MPGTPSVVVLDYGSGNLRSAERALERAGAKVEVTADSRAAHEADGLVVPGVGAFASCAAGLRSVGCERILERRLADGRPVLGICVGMQVLFERGVEFGEEAEGAGRWPGTVEKLQAAVLPHMGWNTVRPPADSVLFAGMPDGERFYFVHSFAAKRWALEAQDPSLPAKLTYAHHGEDFVAAVEDGPLAATQFHPEKSGEAGRRLLVNWLESLR